MKRSLLFCGLWCLACSEEPPVVRARPPVAELAELEGQVTLQRGDTPAATAARGALFENDVVATGTASRALLRGIAGHELELQAQTRFKVGRSLGAITVEQGSISFLVDDLDGGAQVVTQFGRAALKAGTRAVFSVRDGGLAIDVAMGEIELADVDGGTATATKGQRLDVTMGAIEMSELAPASVAAVDAGTAAAAAVGATFAAEAGKPMLKPRGQRTFTPAKKEPAPLTEGTAFGVPPGARARLSTKGLSLRLSNGATGTFEGAKELEDQTVASIDLNAGQAGVSFEAPATVDLGKRGQLRSKAPAALDVTAGKKQATVDVLIGQIELITPEGPKVVKAGERATVGDHGVTVAERARPALLLPLGKRSRVYLKSPTEIGLSLPDEATPVVVATDATFSEVVLKGEGQGRMALTAQPQSELHWRAGEQEGHARFVVDKSAGKADGARSDVVAETGLKATVYFQSAPPALTFTFPSAAGAKAYRLKVYAARDLKTPLVDKKTAENKATVESGQLPEGSYVWYASPLNDAGLETGGGRMNKMDIVYDNSLTTLDIERPADGERAAGAEVAVAGVAPLGSKLWVNGKSIGLEGTGRFRAAVPKAELLVFRLAGADGVESYWLRRLRR